MNAFRAPIAIAASSLVGLTTALLGDGWHDIVAWLALAVPVGAVAWAMLVRRV